MPKQQPFPLCGSNCEEEVQVLLSKPRLHDFGMETLPNNGTDTDLHTGRVNYACCA